MSEKDRLRNENIGNLWGVHDGGRDSTSGAAEPGGHIDRRGDTTRHTEDWGGYSIVRPAANTRHRSCRVLVGGERISLAGGDHDDGI